MFRVSAQSRRGGEVLADYCCSLMNPETPSLSLQAPETSELAIERRELLHARLPDAEVAIIPVASWTATAAIRAVRGLMLASLERARLIVCGNDDMALGVVDLLNEMGLQDKDARRRSLDTTEPSALCLLSQSHESYDWNRACSSASLWRADRRRDTDEIKSP